MLLDVEHGGGEVRVYFLYGFSTITP